MRLERKESREKYFSSGYQVSVPSDLQEFNQNGGALQNGEILSNRNVTKKEENFSFGVLKSAIECL